MSTVLAHADIFPLDAEFIVRSQRTVHLGPVHVAIRSNEEDFGGMRYFPQFHDPCPGDGPEPDYTLNLCNLGLDTPWPLHQLLQEQDNSYRASKFSAGYYITDHFGAPAYLITRGTHYWIFATDFEPILWPYAVKLLLTLYSMQHDTLHLKAACVAVESAGTLLVARGGGGKTVLLTQLCRKGAEFLSNTHTLVDDDTAIGIPTAMRVRSDALFAPVIAARQLATGWKRGEYLAEPRSDLGWQSRTSATLRNICLVDYRGPGICTLEEMDRDILLDYMEHFCLPINVYGLKEDILDHLACDVSRFSTQMRSMKAQLQSLVRNCRCYYLSCDAMNPRALDAIYELLRSAR
jgi:hypothetical protein